MQLADLADAALVARASSMLTAAFKGSTSTAAKKQVLTAYEQFCVGLEIAAFPIDNAREALFLLELCPVASATTWSHLATNSVKLWRSHLKFMRTTLGEMWPGPEHSATLGATPGTIPHALLSRPRLSGACGPDRCR